MIKKFNKVSSLNSNKPNYEPDPKNRRIDLYFTLDGDVIIEGCADNNYTYWLSKTSVNDVELNAQIFNYIANCNYENLASLYKVLPEIGMT